jgi:hypothetical protein
MGWINDIELDQNRRDIYIGGYSSSGTAALRAGMENTSDQQVVLAYNLHVVDLGVDSGESIIFWSNLGQSAHLMKAELDGSNASVIIEKNICGLDLDSNNSLVYWVDCDDNIIQRAKYDGSNIENVVSAENDIGDLLIDEVQGKIYWSESSAGKIRRSNIDGTDVEDIVVGVSNPDRLALYSKATVGLSADPSSRREVSTIYQNYPNPFAATTTISFKLATQSHVTLDIYDMLGRRVDVLVSADYPPGTNHVTWNASRLADGVYIGRIRAGDYSETIRLVLDR